MVSRQSQAERLPGSNCNFEGVQQKFHRSIVKMRIDYDYAHEHEKRQCPSCSFLSYAVLVIVIGKLDLA